VGRFLHAYPQFVEVLLEARVLRQPAAVVGPSAGLRAALTAVFGTMEVRAMLVVHGIYDGKVVRLLEPIQVESPYRVTVTFLEPLGRDTPTTGEDNLERFIGMWVDFTPEEDQVFQAILEERASYFAGREVEFGEEEPT
jgi:hypothetical protein